MHFLSSNPTENAETTATAQKLKSTENTVETRFYTLFVSENAEIAAPATAQKQKK